MAARTKKAACHVPPSPLTQRLCSMATLMPRFTLERRDKGQCMDSEDFNKSAQLVQWCGHFFFFFLDPICIPL